MGNQISLGKFQLKVKIIKLICLKNHTPKPETGGILSISANLFVTVSSLIVSNPLIVMCLYMFNIQLTVIMCDPFYPQTESDPQKAMQIAEDLQPATVMLIETYTIYIRYR